MAAARRVDVISDADVAAVRRAVRAEAVGVGDDVVGDAELLASELVTNALFHGGGVAGVEVLAIPGGVRVEVSDRNRHAPLEALASSEAMTGRGMSLVRQLATRWGVEPRDDGKMVWAEITDVARTSPELSAEDVLAQWGEDWDDVEPLRVTITLGEVPTGLLVAAKRHVDNLVREFRLAVGGESSGTTAAMPEHLSVLVDRFVSEFEDARLQIKRQATEAARAGSPRTSLQLHLEPTAADAAERYLEILDDVDGYSRANRLLTLETPPQHRVFRHWYIGEIVRQLRAAEAGLPPPPTVPFEDRLLAEIDAAESARRAADRAARLYSVTTALAAATTAEEVSAAVLGVGATALGASGGGILLRADEDRLLVPGTVGYDDTVVERLRAESPDAELPAAHALRTQQPVWLETIEERNERFPALQGFEPTTTAMCAVPLAVAGRTLGALRFSFRDQRLFDDAEQQFVLALASEAAQALERANLLGAEREARLHAERERESLEMLSAVGEAMLRGRELDDILQLATDAGTQICGAEFGAFFYNAVNDAGESYLLYTLSGVPRAAFGDFPMPRNTAIFAPTFSGEAIVRLDDVTADPRFGHNPPYEGLPQGHLPVRSYLAVPVLLSDGAVAGGLFFGHHEIGTFSDAHERLLAGVAGQAAAAIENVSVAAERQLIATQLQQSLLPAELPTIPDLDLGAFYRAATSAVGGDFYDLFRLDEGRWGIAIGDVRGRGPRAAAVTATARHTIRAAAHLGRSPTEVCQLLNTILLSADDDEEFLTVTYIELALSLRGAVATYVNAGHPPPLLVHDQNTTEWTPTGPMIGVSPDGVFQERRHTMAPGDVLVLYTDGVTEARRDAEEFTIDMLSSLLSPLASLPARSIAAAINTEVETFVGGDLSDDAAIFVVKLLPPNGLA